MPFYGNRMPSHRTHLTDDRMYRLWRIHLPDWTARRSRSNAVFLDKKLSLSGYTGEQAVVRIKVLVLMDLVLLVFAPLYFTTAILNHDERVYCVSVFVMFGCSVALVFYGVFARNSCCLLFRLAMQIVFLVFISIYYVQYSRRIAILEEKSGKERNELPTRWGLILLTFIVICELWAFRVFLSTFRHFRSNLKTVRNEPDIATTTPSRHREEATSVPPIVEDASSQPFLPPPTTPAEMEPEPEPHAGTPPPYDAPPTYEQAISNNAQWVA